VGSVGAGTVFRRAIPGGDLVPGQTIRVVADGQVRSTFVVADFSDDDAPAPPGASLQDVRTCGPVQSAVTVGVASEDAVFFIGLVDGEPTLGGGVRLDGASSSDELLLFASGSAVVHVAAVDVAGNVSASVPVEVSAPALCTCATSSDARGSAAALMGAVLLALQLRLSRARSRASRNVR
jgi:hypothetical protein